MTSSNEPPPLPTSREDAVSRRRTAANTPDKMGWSLKLGTYAGIDVYLHWTFTLLIVWIFFGQLGASGSAQLALLAVAFVLALFVCVILHEFGHALTARHYGIPTRDITLLPIGGVARLERMPDKPLQEFWVAVAGPAVNVAIAALLYVVLLASGSTADLTFTDGLRAPFLARLLWINLFLAGFNLLPAFPMDGGRVLRALLATRLGRRRATAIAAKVGQGMAILFGLGALLGTFNPFLVLIAVFVFFGAQAEAQSVETESVLAGLRVRDAMITRFRTLSAGDPISRAVEELLSGSQQDFPVLQDGTLAGVLRRNDLVKALAEGRRDSPVGEAMCRDCGAIGGEELLTSALTTLRGQPCSTLPVLDRGQLVGLLTWENVSEIVMVNSALEQSQVQR
jgi:Zn-dependent protease/predicted transcriptional regulator